MEPFIRYIRIKYAYAKEELKQLINLNLLSESDVKTNLSAQKHKIVNDACRSNLICKDLLFKCDEDVVFRIDSPNLVVYEDLGSYSGISPNLMQLN